MKKILIMAGLILLSLACKNKNAKNTVHSEHTKDTAGVYYTCSMHPQVMLDKPGNCPICGMKLIEVKKSITQDDNEVKLNEQQIQLGNILTDTIHNGMMIGDQMVLTATLNADQQKINAVSARVMGRVERLYFKNLGDYVHKGDKLYDLYSEELNNAKQEYILSLEKKENLDNSTIDFNGLVQSAKNKLALWGLSESQIKDLASTKVINPVTTFYSPVSGYITTLDIREGEYINEGGTIVRITNLSSLWAEAQVYISQLSQIDVNATAHVQFPDLPDREMTGKIEFTNPEANPQTRITLLRVNVANSDNLLKPGMPAYVIIKGKQVNALTLPSDAVLRTGTGASVWVQTGNRSFKTRMVEIGMEDGDRVQIKSGLQPGDVIVISGAYLLNSEYIFKKGANPMAGMKM
ncbi:efflux RND transporter periplasmic adaptor subunit [Hydrotalea sp.]|uniref:efflux RND transporter periplasmic adaptor subunit n=1 Tax=Hydrotalea sp. TaxID=2881279 RepID=UPI00258F20D1|nr:efflux RND transporter periplasmic adaptor subunit [Hydrotalea sp.]